MLALVRGFTSLRSQNKDCSCPHTWEKFYHTFELPSICLSKKESCWQPSFSLHQTSLLRLAIARTSYLVDRSLTTFMRTEFIKVNSSASLCHSWHFGLQPAASRSTVDSPFLRRRYLCACLQHPLIPAVLTFAPRLTVVIYFWHK